MSLNCLRTAQVIVKFLRRTIRLLKFSTWIWFPPFPLGRMILGPHNDLIGLEASRLGNRLRESDSVNIPRLRPFL